MIRLAKFSFWLLIGFLLSACDRADEQTRGRGAIGKFHDLYNESKYSEIYYAADPIFRKKVTEEGFSRNLALIKRTFGNYGGLNDGYHFPVEVTPELATLKVSVSSYFEKSKCTEEFEFKREGGLHLLEYRANRDDRPQ